MVLFKTKNKAGAPRRPLGQQSAAVHLAYAKNAIVTVPSLDEWNELVANKIIDVSKLPKVA
jgi:hypothetical protein